MKSIAGQAGWSKECEQMRYYVVYEQTDIGWSAYVPDLPGVGVALALQRANYFWLLMNDRFPQPRLRNRLATITDHEIEFIHLHFLTNCELFTDPTINEAIRTGARRANPPTIIIE